MVYYAHSKSLVKVEQMNEDFTLLTFAGEELGVAGDYVGTHENGDKEVIPKEVFEEEYVPVQLVKEVNSKQLSPFEEQHYRMLFGDASGLNQEEDQDYIENMKKLVQNKAF